jgi:LuxR family maltose regulon positive regulatory protein
MRAWMSSLAGDREDAATAIAVLEDMRWPDDRPLPDGSGSLEASLATLRAAFSWGDVGSAHAHALRAIQLMPRESALRSGAAWALAVSYYYVGDLDAADRGFEEAVEVGLRDERWLVTASALAYRSLIAGAREQVDEQRLLAEDAADVARQRGLEEIVGEVHVAVGLAVEARRGLEHALPYLDRGVAVLRSGQPLDFALALLHQARVLQATGPSEAAAAAIGEAAATIASCPDPGILSARLDALERAPLARKSDARLSGRELIVLRMLKGSLSERDIGRELYLSHNTIHSHTKSIYRKLGVSSRKQAVQRGLNLGLL